MVKKFSKQTKLTVFLLIFCLLGFVMVSPSAVHSIGPIEPEYNFAVGLQMGLHFYDSNMCGPVTGERLPWRGPCHMEDAEVPLIPMTEDSFGTNMSQEFIDEHRDILDPEGKGTVDLSGGFHDAGDHIKFGLPGSYAASTVGWGFYEFRDAYEEIGVDDHVKDILRWYNDFYLKATFRDDDGDIVAYAYQVAEGDIDHNFWNPPELQHSEILLDFSRPAHFATVETPASDQCAGAAASLAINYLNFKDEDPEYAEECLDTAIALYDFAVENRGLGFDGGFYTSSYDYDEMAWAAVWLHIATGDWDYIEDINRTDEDGYYTGYFQRIFADPGDSWQNIWVHCWDTVWGGVFAKLAPITDTERDWYVFRWNLEYWSGIPHEDPTDTTFLAQSPAGFSVVNPYGSARYNTAAQLCAVTYSKETGDMRFAEWAKDQMEYIMGDNPMERSYIVGYGENHAEHPHHRAAHGSRTFSMLDPEEHRFTLWGALVGGPDLDDYHVDCTTDYIYNEVAVDYNAGFVGALAGLYEFFGEGHYPLEDFPPEPDPVLEFYSEAKVEQENDERTQVTLRLNNYSAYPPRFETELKMRYYFNISELIAAGQTIDDVVMEVYYDENEAGYDGPAEYNGPFKHDDAGTYYVEIDWTDRIVYGKRDVQFAIMADQDSNFNSNWDPTNDFSRQGLNDDDFVITENIPVYIGDELVYGEEPEPVIPEPTPEPDPDATPEPEVYSLEVEYKSGLSVTDTNDIRAAVNVKNTGTAPVDLSDVTVRYWYTRDGDDAQEFSSSYAHIGSENITGVIREIEDPVELADSYLEIGFTSDAGTLGAGSQTGEIQFKIEKVTFEAYDQTNDYSFLDTDEFLPNPNITAYVNSSLAYGDEPVEISDGDIVYGDLNGDGVVDSTDAVLLSRYILEITDSFPAPLESADLNGDGVIDSTDAVLMSRYVLEMISSFPVE
ncbi:glycoside hydrolase family 9 protein [Herbivorax sp. ANBcel31]|uniref:glycoside hydrolase family 9 protein n=1 Tax=Herbivorax sp. ANBcel31 TaxID=3069754 RepID=UPI0027AE0B13|nr:glycoside hydrolase family 9 protein [Herbivorax sp. ANBcel31]MDQ2086829.1 glycoside hydrolase family 9 protein [Herbivorax sp. ANBcel31]